MRYKINRVNSTWWVSALNDLNGKYLMIAGFQSEKDAREDMNKRLRSDAYEQLWEVCSTLTNKVEDDTQELFNVLEAHIFDYLDSKDN